MNEITVSEDQLKRILVDAIALTGAPLKDFVLQFCNQLGYSPAKHDDPVLDLTEHTFDHTDLITQAPTGEKYRFQLLVIDSSVEQPAEAFSRFNITGADNDATFVEICTHVGKLFLLAQILFVALKKNNEVLKDMIIQPTVKTTLELVQGDVKSNKQLAINIVEIQ